MKTWPTYAEKRRRKATVLAWVAVHGFVCPRCGHRTTDLTADHVIPRFEGGELGPLRVLCRRCNSTRRGWGWKS